MLISIASGKGGTGKTTLALLLAAAKPDTTLIDCDVEEPNCHLFLHTHWQDKGQEIYVMTPEIDALRCTGCGACATVCLFSALAVSGKKAMLFDELCHSCGGCVLACPSLAIQEKKKSIGIINLGSSSVLPNTMLITGTLNIGTPSAVPLIKALRKKATSLTGDVLLDCPPGTACSMVTAVKNSDYCILVTEPNLFGMHDLELAMNITQLLNIPTGVVINKSDTGKGDVGIEEICRKRHIPILAKLPHSLAFAKQYASGQIPDEFTSITADIWQQLSLETKVIT